MPINFEVYKNGERLSRHTAKDEAEQAKIIEGIRLMYGRGILSKNDGITSQTLAPEVKVAVATVVRPAEPINPRPAPRKFQAKARPQQPRREQVSQGTNLKALLQAALAGK